MFEPTELIVILTLYLGFVFLIAYATDSNWIPRKLTDNPFIYTLSLGAYVGAWAIFGVVEIAQDYGYIFMAYFFGTSALFIFSPLILQPLFTLSRTYRLSSLADLFSFRYNSKWAGVFVCIGTVAAVLPLMAMQISAIFETSEFLITPENSSFFETRLIPLLLCVVVVVFTILFGSTPDNAHARHRGLVVALAYQSLLKLFFLLTIGLVAIYTVFGSFANLEHWLIEKPEKLSLLHDSLSSNNTRSLMLVFLAAALAFPHMYQLAITENRDPKAIYTASWAFPLYLLLLSLPILPIVWAGEASNADEPYFYALMIGELANSPVITIFTYLAGVAAATTSMIIIVSSVASMCINHLFLPFYPAVNKLNVFGWLKRLRNVFISLLVVIGYLTFEFSSFFSIIDGLGFAAYSAAFQFLPGILAVFYWPRGNRKGLTSGLCVGYIIWFVTIFLPLFGQNSLGLQTWLTQYLDLHDGSYWTLACAASLGFNMLTFGIVSLMTPMDQDEHDAARICSQDDLNKPIHKDLYASSVQDFIDKLSEVIDGDTAEKEVHHALVSLNMETREKRPFALRLLRRQVESNLSGLFGPTVARQIVNKQLPYSENHDTIESQDIQLIEHRLEQSQLPLSGIAEELNNLRRYHRNTLESLPIGICTISVNNEILMWNKAMAELTGIPGNKVIGSDIFSIEQPWLSTFTGFIQNDEEHKHNLLVETAESKRWFTLHKTNQASNARQSISTTFLMEETTATVQLEQEVLHKERLASIGQLAAGVAHEIGNPITGIACLAQNLKYDTEQPEIIDTAKDILTQTDRVTRIVQSLVNFSHTGSNLGNFMPSPVNMYECIDDAIHLLSLDQSLASERINNLVDRDTVVQGDTQQLLQIFLNLLKNGLDSSPDKASVQITSKTLLNDVIIEVADNGPGIPESIQSQIFDPFFTTKDTGDGTGLGLSLTYSMIEEHGGDIKVISPYPESAQHGTCFVIRLPALETEA